MDDALDRQAFFEVMASFPIGVAVVTTVDAAGIPRALTTTAVCILHEDAIAWAECTVACEVDVADHSLVVGKVVAGGLSAELEAPLLYYRRSWGVWAPAQEPSEPEPVEIPSVDVGGRDLRWQGVEF